MTMRIDSTREGPGKDQTSKIQDNVKRGKVFTLNAKPDKYRDSAPNPEDLKRFRLVPTDQSNLGLWEQAWVQVKKEEEDWKLWPQFQRIKDLNTRDEVTKVHDFAQKRCDDAKEHQRHVFGTSLTYREMCGKVAKCAEKFRIVGDVVAQAEPVYAALPWVNTTILDFPFAVVDF